MILLFCPYERKARWPTADGRCRECSVAGRRIGLLTLDEMKVRGS